MLNGVMLLWLLLTAMALAFVAVDMRSALSVAVFALALAAQGTFTAVIDVRLLSSRR